MADQVFARSQDIEKHPISDNSRRLNEAKPLALSHHIEGYTAVRSLGRGSQGEVVLAERDCDHTLVAIKKLNIESVKNWKEYELFQREASVLSTLDIPGIAKFYEAFECLDDKPPCAYIVQEYIPGYTLAEKLKAGHRFTLDRIYDLILQLTEILQALHSHNPPVIHRDIKPSNILLKPLEGDDFQVYLIDFGAVANPQIQSGGSTVAGTYGFMPPEQLMGKPSVASDYYALAAVAVNLITGISPADMAMKDFYLMFEPHMQFMPVAVVNLLRRMLEPDISKRLYNYKEIHYAFQMFQADRYDLEDAGQSAFSIIDNDFDLRLRNVKSYGEPGNVELWQRLQDHTPRVLPASYRNRDSYPEYNDLMFGKDSSKYFDAYMEKKSELDKKLEVHGKYSREKGLGDVISGLFFIAMGILGAILFTGSDYGETGMMIFILVSIPVYFIAMYFIKQWIAKRRTIHGFFDNAPTNSFSSTGPMLSVDSLLREGRKTIATVVDIKYQPVAAAKVERSLKNSQYAVHQAPEWVITYAFNPPDDSDPNDLVHEFRVHASPEEFLRPGDPLPILYSINIMGNHHSEYVFSIPFPLVLNQMDIKSLPGSSVFKG